MGQATTTPRRILRSPGQRRLLLRVAHSPDSTALSRDFDLTAQGASWTFGREGAGALNDPRLSRRHCRVSFQAGAIRVEDLGSSNGTFVDGEPIQQGYLHPNSVLRVGDSLLVLDEEPAQDQRLPSEAFDTPVPELVGISFATASVRAWIATAAPTPNSVLLLGPTGAGKDVAARALHRLSGRRGPFVAVNCSAIAPELADAELFGHKRGAFTGAEETRQGLFQAAHGGTLFLDEVGDLPLALQTKLLRAVEERKIRPVGDLTPRDVDVRIVAATNVDLAASGFREDLKERLGQWVIDLPPLAARKSDVLPLARHFAEGHGTRAHRLTAELAEALLLHGWPRNVRELENSVRQWTALAPGAPEWDITLLSREMQQRVLARDADDATTDAPSRRELESALAEAEGNVSRVADRFGRKRAQVYRWLARHGLDPASYR